MLPLDPKTKENVMQFCREIRSRQLEIVELNKKIIELNNQKHCDKCDRVNQMEVKFRSECGQEFTQVVTIEMATTQTTVDAINRATRPAANEMVV